MNQFIQHKTSVYGFVLINVCIFGYKFLSPERSFYPILASWHHFAIGVAVFVVAVVAARAFATWQWRRKQHGQEKLV
jgi:hypothetical protein